MTASTKSPQQPEAPARLSLGMVAPKPGRRSENERFIGAQVVGAPFTDAFLQHSTAETISLFSHRTAHRDLSVQLDRKLGATPQRRRISVLDGSGLAGASINCWLDIHGKAVDSFLLRARAAKPFYPVAAVHHTISYSYLLHDYFLGLLLSDVTPYDSIVCTSEAARRAHRAILDEVAERANRAHGTRLSFRGRLDLIPLGVDTAVFCPRDKADCRVQLALPPDAFIILWTGRLSLQSKADLAPFLPVFSQLRINNPDRRLLLVVAGHGDAEEIAALERIAATLGDAAHVVFRAMESETRPILYAAADVFVSPVDNLQESFGISPIEAMACGVPQVVSDWDGYRDTVEHDVTGFLVPTLWTECDGEAARCLEYIDVYDGFTSGQSVAVDMERYQSFLQVLIESDQRRAEMSARSRARAVARYDWRVIVRQYEALWRELIERSAGDAVTLPGGADYAVPHYFKAFQGFPSAVLSGDAPLGPTAEAAKARAGTSVIFKAGSRAWAVTDLQPDVLQDLVALLLRPPADGRPWTLDRLVDAATRRHGPGRDRWRRHVMWLIKYGLARVVDALAGGA